MSCPQIGNGGLHSEAYFDDGSCAFCGACPETPGDYLAHNHPPDSMIQGTPVYEVNAHPDCKRCKWDWDEMMDEDA